MKSLKYYSALLTIVTMFLVGCSSQNNPAIPTAEIRNTASSGSHSLWGMYQFTYDPSIGTLEVIPLRSTAMHLNALPFLEPPVLTNLSLEGLTIDPADPNHITALIGLRHPFLGLTEFTGFDVCGILIGNGSAIFGATGLKTAADYQTHLLNPDGFTRWWNPDEFPSDGTIFNYKDGLLGTPDSVAGYNAQVNGYKFYCSAFDVGNPDAPISSLDPSARHEFNAGDKVIRTYDIKFGDTGWIFNYAVDANWVFPQGSPPWTLDDFPPEANRPEAWNVTITEVENTLWNYGGSSGGNLILNLRVFDHFNAELSEINISGPGITMSESTLIDYGTGWADYLIEFNDQEPGQAGDIPLYIEVACEESGYGGHLSGVSITAYFLAETTVAGEPMEKPDPPENFRLEVLRSNKPGEHQSIDGLKLHWDDVPAAAEYAVYYDSNPYDGVTPATLMGTTANLEFSYDMSASDLNEAFVFVVRSRGISGNPATESDDSEQAFVEFEGFEKSSPNPGLWGIGNESSASTFLIALQHSGWINSGLYYAGNLEWEQSSYHAGQSWTILYSPQLPTIDNIETVAFELVHKHRQVNTDSGIQMGTMPTPPAADTGTATYTVFDGTNDYISGTAYNEAYEWAIQSKFGPPTNHWQFHTEVPFTFSAYDCITGYTGGHRYVGLGYATTSGTDAISVSFEDIAVVIY